MNNQGQLLFTQSQIATLAKVDKSTIHRKVTVEKIEAVSQSASSNSKKYSLEETQRILRTCRRGDIPTKKIHVFYNFKGGTGKSSLSSQVAYHLAILGFKVLAVDLDPQAHMTFNLGFVQETDFLTMADVLINGREVSEVISPLMPGLDIIPASLKLTRIEVPLTQKNRREELLDRVLSPLSEDYDFIIVDTNPTISILNVNALVAADQINVVCATHPLSYHGLGILIEDLKSLFTDLEKDLNFRIIPNLYEAKTVTAQEILGALRSEYGKNVVENVIRKSEDINLATKNGLPLCAFAKKSSSGLEDILDLTYEIIKHSCGTKKENFKGMKKQRMGKNSNVHTDAHIN